MFVKFIKVKEKHRKQRKFIWSPRDELAVKSEPGFCRGSRCSHLQGWALHVCSTGNLMLTDS